MEADSAGFARAELAESASTGFQGLTQKSPTVISRMDTYLHARASENPIQKILKTLGEDSFCVSKFSKKLVLRYGCFRSIITLY